MELVFEHIRDHLQNKDAQKKIGRSKAGRTKKIYPYTPVDDMSDVEKAERNLFNVLALYIFEKGDLASSDKKTTKAIISLIERNHFQQSKFIWSYP